MHVGGFHAVPGRCRGLRGLAGASKGLQGPPGAFGGGPRDLEGPPKPTKTSRNTVEVWASLHLCKKGSFFLPRVMWAKIREHGI